jgi:hypothetical protein
MPQHATRSGLTVFYLRDSSDALAGVIDLDATMR